MGQDQTLLYVRTLVEEKVKHYPFPTWYNWYGNSRPIIGATRTVGFCGKVYGVLTLYQFETEEQTICHTLEAVDAFMEARGKKDDLDDYYGQGKPKRRFSYNRARILRKDIEKFFDNYAGARDKYHELFIEHQSPVFVAKYLGSGQDSTITWNDCLRSVEFFRVFDPYTAFQEIAMFMANLAVPLKEIPAVSNCDMIEAKGFDKKWSFRKEPQK